MPENEAVPNGNEQAQDASTNANQEQAEAFVFDKWYDSQPEQVKGGIDDHVHGLKSALQSERTSRETLEKRIKTLTGEVEKGSKLQQELEKLSNELTDTTTKADFFREAHEARVVDLELAWLAAKNSNLFDKRGAVDMRALREAHPALFAPAKTPVPPGNSGNGVGQEMPRRFDMNDAIRAAARGR